MKKLMVMAAVAVAAMFSQAASLDWGITSTQLMKQYYVFNASDRAQIVGLLEAGTASGTAAELIATFESKKVAMGATSTGGTAEGTLTVPADVTDYSYFAVILNKNTTKASQADKYYLSADVTGHSYTAATSSTKVAADINSFSSAQVIQAVPEPTSAMLLVLGVAGLALKRKRA